MGIACKISNRNFIGIEIDEKYFNIAKERLENDNYDNQKKQIVGQLSLF